MMEMDRNHQQQGPKFPNRQLSDMYYQRQINTVDASKAVFLGNIYIYEHTFYARNIHGQNQCLA